MRNQFSTVGILPEDFSQWLIIIETWEEVKVRHVATAVMVCCYLALVGSKVSEWVGRLDFCFKYHTIKICILLLINDIVRENPSSIPSRNNYWSNFTYFTAEL
jgi:hypothetical protein